MMLNKGASLQAVGPINPQSKYYKPKMNEFAVNTRVIKEQLAEQMEFEMALRERGYKVGDDPNIDQQIRDKEAYMNYDPSAPIEDSEDPHFNKMHVFTYSKQKAGMASKTEEQLSNMMKDMKVSNKMYYILKEKKMRDIQAKAEKMVEKVNKIKSNSAVWAKNTNECKRRHRVYKEEMDIERTWMHVDMDMFFAACEIRDRPDLADKPVAVGGYDMIQTTNYVARKWGCRSAMPGFMGKQLCPALVFVKSDKEKYTRISNEEFLPILRQYDPHLESVGLDEANLDVTNYLKQNGMDCPEGRIFLG